MLRSAAPVRSQPAAARLALVDIPDDIRATAVGDLQSQTGQTTIAHTGRDPFTVARAVTLAAFTTTDTNSGVANAQRLERDRLCALEPGFAHVAPLNFSDQAW